MIAGSVARRYARALLAIGQATRSSDGLWKELDRVSVIFQGSTQLMDTLKSPVFKLSNRRAVLEELARRLALSKTAKNFMFLLLDRGRIAALPDIVRELRVLVDQSAGRVRVTVTTARPLDTAAEMRLKTALERRTGKTVILEKREDASLLGGVIAQIGDVVYDGSVSTQLANLRQQLLAS